VIRHTLGYAVTSTFPSTVPEIVPLYGASAQFTGPSLAPAGTTRATSDATAATAIVVLAARMVLLLPGTRMGTLNGKA
jgi:hypothetical protein